MKRYRMIAALGAFLGLLLLKTAFPGLAAELREGAVPVGEVRLSPEDILIVGNEGHGVPPELSAAADGSVYLPISPEAESLNAAAAASVFLYLQREGER